MKRTNILFAGLVALGLCGLKAGAASDSQALSAADCGLVRGLLPTATTLSTGMESYTSTDWSAYVAVRNQMGDAVSKALAKVASQAQSPALQTQLQGAVQTVLSAPRECSGSAQCWQMVASSQDKTFAKAAQQLKDLQTLCVAQ